ncbi:centrosomal protein of 57 kDa isoform X1 [Simochromis diagramma]|uniref:centrosomal protein of 57 kDa isoform X1 n=1 Tax=Simochromis diagramma TaxID=43689 RepID=UPI001A7E4291|nr:centrosomal protein of 57 kDa isoform X1 [Simochromis diagramma]
METLPKTLAADATRETESYPPPPPTCGPVPDSLSLPSYKDYPAHRPFINTLVHHRPQTHTHQSYVPSSPIKAFPETNSTVILSALRNLQEKIRRLEMEKGHAERSLHALGKDASQTLLQNEDITSRLLNDQKNPEIQRSAHSNCNQVLINHLAAAESRCLKLERQLDHMRRMLRNARTERTNLLKQQDILQKAKSAEWQSDTASQYAQFDKLERLEQEYLRLTRTQNISEMKILELEMKLQEEEYQRKLIQDKANQLQTGLDASRILLQSVSPCRSAKKPKEKKSNTKKSSQQYSHTEPHYRLSLRDVPFVAGTSVGCSHSVRANVQSVLSLLKRHQPHLCNSRVLSRNTNGSGTDGHRHSDSSSSSSSASGEELSELLQALQEELRLMSLEHDELMRQVEDCVFEQERKELRRVQERLLLKMERKGEQISKLYKHKSQIKKLRKEANCRQSNGNELRVSTTVSTRGHSAAAVKARPGDRSKMNLRLLRDMKALQTSLRT